MRRAHSSRSSVRFSRRYATSSCSSVVVLVRAIVRIARPSRSIRVLVRPPLGRGSWSICSSSSGRPSVASRLAPRRPADRGSWQARTASAGSVEEEAGDRGGHVLLAERRRRREHADDQPDQRLGQPRARDVVADVAVGLAPLEQPAQRLGEGALEAARGRIAARRRARSTNGSPTSTSARTARAMPSGGATSSILADASRSLDVARPRPAPARRAGLSRFGK